VDERQIRGAHETLPFAVGEIVFVQSAPALRERSWVPVGPWVPVSPENVDETGV